jgi:hypothetical protein
MIKRTAITHNGSSFLCTAEQAKALEVLLDTNAGGFASVKGYVSESGRTSPETADITFISRFSTEKLYQRKMEALLSMTADTVLNELRDDPKIKALTTDEFYTAFEARKAYEIESMQKTLDGVRDDARRESHDRNYLTLTSGVKVHFVTEKGSDNLTYPVLDTATGLPIVNSIMLSTIQVSKNVLVKGEYKVVNSKVPTLISKAMEKHLPKSCKFKNVSLKEDNFTALHIAGQELIPEDFKALYVP